MLTPQIVAAVESKVLDVLLQCQSIYGMTFEIPEIRYDTTGMRGGLAYYNRWMISLNLDFFKQNFDVMINVTVPHEIAHLVSYKVYGPVLGAGHGRCWKSVMVRLGLPPKRCHDFNVDNLRRGRHPRNWVYTCPCGCELKLTKRMHNSIQSEGPRRCRKHSQLVTFKGQLSV